MDNHLRGFRDKPLVALLCATLAFMACLVASAVFSTPAHAVEDADAVSVGISWYDGTSDYDKGSRVKNATVEMDEGYTVADLESKIAADGLTPEEPVWINHDFAGWGAPSFVSENTYEFIGQWTEREWGQNITFGYKGITGYDEIEDRDGSMLRIPITETLCDPIMRDDIQKSDGFTDGMLVDASKIPSNMIKNFPGWTYSYAQGVGDRNVGTVTLYYTKNETPDAGDEEMKINYEITYQGFLGYEEEEKFVMGEWVTSQNPIYETLHEDVVRTDIDLPWDCYYKKMTDTSLLPADLVKTFDGWRFENYEAWANDLRHRQGIIVTYVPDESEPPADADDDEQFEEPSLPGDDETSDDEVLSPPLDDPAYEADSDDGEDPEPEPVVETEQAIETDATEHDVPATGDASITTLSISTFAFIAAFAALVALRLSRRKR